MILTLLFVYLLFQKVNQHKHLLEELRILKDVKHKRVLKMFNFVEGDNNPCLIYPFMKNGSLCDFLMRNVCIHHIITLYMKAVGNFLFLVSFI